MKGGEDDVERAGIGQTSGGMILLTLVGGVNLLLTLFLSVAANATVG
jgi:hypothetical protein